MQNGLDSENEDILSSHVEDTFRILVTKFGKDALTYIPSTLIPSFVSFASVFIFTRIFTPGDYGKYVLAISLIGMFDLLLSGWLQQATLRHRAKYVENNNTHLFNRNLMKILIIISFFVLSTSCILYFLLKSLINPYIKIYWSSIVLIITGLWFTNLYCILLADLKSRTYALLIIVNSILSFMFTIIWVLFIDRDISALIIGLFLSQLCLLGPLIFLSGIFGREVNTCQEQASHIKYERKLLNFFKEVARYGFPLIGWLLGSFILTFSDRYMIQVFKGSAEVGIYAPNYNLVKNAFGLISAPMVLAAHTILMKSFTITDNDMQSVMQTIREFSRYYLDVAIPFAFFMAAYSKDIVNLFLGEEFREGYIIVPVILVGFLAWDLAVFGHKVLEIENRTATMLLYVVISAVINIVLNLIFIPWLGFLGAAITTTIGYLTYPIMVYYGSRKVLKWRIPWRSIWKASAASMGMLVFLIPFKLFMPIHQPIIMLFISVLLGIVIYLTGLLILHEIESFKLEYIKKLFVHGTMK